MAQKPAKRAVRGAKIAYAKTLELLKESFPPAQIPEVIADFKRFFAEDLPGMRKEAAALAKAAQSQKAGTKKAAPARAKPKAEPKAAPKAAPKAKKARGVRPKTDFNAFKRAARTEQQINGEVSADYATTG